MTADERRKLFQQLSTPFPSSAYVHTSGAITGKGYDTVGLRATTLLSRLQEQLGVGCYRIHRDVTVTQALSPKGRTVFNCVVDMTLEVGFWDENNVFKIIAETVGDGGASSFLEWDSRKSATTSALKRCLAGLGIGKECWEGTPIDEDDEPLPDEGGMPQAREPHRVQLREVPSGPTSMPEVTVRRQSNAAPATAPAPAAIPEPTRNRVSSKQIGAVWAISRKAGLEQGSLRAQVLKQYGVKLEFLSRQQASELIDALSRKVSSNGHADGGAEAASGA